MSTITLPPESCTEAVHEKTIRSTAGGSGTSAGAWRVFVAANVVGLIVLALAMRLWQLGHVPGINGDEAEYAVRAIRFLRGEPVVWRTPTGNLVNPFFFFPQAAVHALAEPSFAVLRAIAVISGLTGLALNYVLCRRLYGQRAALVTTVLLAVLPINIAYSRFAWDTCQTLAASTLVVYPALLMLTEPHRRGRWLTLGLVGYAAAYLVHPTNVFLGGFLVAVLLVQRRDELAAIYQQRSPLTWACCGLVAILSIAAASWLARDLLAIGRVDTFHPAAIAEFVRNYGRLFNGITVYRYLAGSHGPETITSVGWPYDFGLCDAAALVALVGAMLIVWREALRSRGLADAGLLVGWALVTGGFLLVAGPEAIRPHWERYGLCLILPGALVAGRAASIVIARPAPFGRLATFTTLAIAWLLLGDFAASYFQFMHTTGGRSQETFRTAAVEPKQAAFDLIAATVQNGASVTIVAQEWWNYWPLAYLAAGRSGMSVERSAVGLPDGRAWFVEFAGSAHHARLRRELVESGRGWRERFVCDYAGRPTLVLFEPAVSQAGAAREAVEPLRAAYRVPNE